MPSTYPIIQTTMVPECRLRLPQPSRLRPTCRTRIPSRCRLRLPFPSLRLIRRLPHPSRCLKDTPFFSRLRLPISPRLRLRSYTRLRLLSPRRLRPRSASRLRLRSYTRLPRRLRLHCTATGRLPPCSPRLPKPSTSRLRRDPRLRPAVTSPPYTR